MKEYQVNLTSWDRSAFVELHASVPYELVLGSLLLNQVILQLKETAGEKKLSANIPELLIPALLVFLGTDPKKCVAPEFKDAIFEFGGNRYQLGYVFDPVEHEYGWYIIAL